MLGKMHDRVRPERFDDGGEKIVVADVTGMEFDDFAREILPDFEAFGEGLNRSQRLGANFVVPLATDEIIDNADGVPLT